MNKTLKNPLFNVNALTLLILLASFLASISASNVAAQKLEKVIPMGEWASFLEVRYTEKPIRVHLRTGYERAVLLPEAVTIESIQGVSVIQNQTDNLLPGCAIELDIDVIGFSPLRQFDNHSIKLRGLESYQLYELVVNSSPTGSRQPIDIQR